MAAVEKIEANAAMQPVLARVQSGTEVLLTRNGKPVARVIAISERDAKRAAEAVRAIREFSHRRTLHPYSGRDLVNEVRKY
jgi:prevent-host-death family protein